MTFSGSDRSNVSSNSLLNVFGATGLLDVWSKAMLLNATCHSNKWIWNSSSLQFDTNVKNFKRTRHPCTSCFFLQGMQKYGINGRRNEYVRAARRHYAYTADAKRMMVMMMMMMVIHHLQSFAAQIRRVASTEDIILSCRSAELTELKSILDSDLGQDRVVDWGAHYPPVLHLCSGADHCSCWCQLFCLWTWPNSSHIQIWLRLPTSLCALFAQSQTMPMVCILVGHFQLLDPRYRRLQLPLQVDLQWPPVHSHSWGGLIF